MMARAERVLRFCIFGSVGVLRADAARRGAQQLTALRVLDITEKLAA